jgi:hypothetical protein
MPIVKATLKVQFFQSLKKGTAKAIKIKHDRRHICLKRVLILFESKSKL